MRNITLFYLITTVALALNPIYKNINFIEPTMTDKENFYEIQKNDMLSIEFISNPSTGYSWVWVNEDTNSHIEKLSSNFVADNPQAVGGGGIETWEFKGVSEGEDTLRFEYKRAWDPGSIIESKEIIVRVRALIQ